MFTIKQDLVKIVSSLFNSPVKLYLKTTRKTPEESNEKKM